MSILSMSSSRPLHEIELEQITQLAVTLSAQLTRVHVDGIAPAIADALQRVAAVTRVETCRVHRIQRVGHRGARARSDAKRERR